jgi:Lsr2
MTQKVVLVDDIDGASQATTVRFSYEGRNFEIDLSSRNRAAMRKAIKPYTDAARNVGSRRRGRVAKSASGKNDPKVIRAWALQAGYPLSARGRVPAEVIDAYRKAH